MGKSNSEHIAFVGKIALTKRWVSRRQPAKVPQHRSHAAVELMGESGEAVAFDRYQLSSVGAYLFSEYLHCEGETLMLRLTLPHVETPLIVEGEVVNANMDGDSGMGVIFRNLRSQEKKILQDHIARKFLKNV